MNQTTNAGIDLFAHDFNEDVNREYPLPDNPHASVIQRVTENRAAMWRGIMAVINLARRAEPSVAADARDIIAFGASLLGHASDTDALDDNEAREWVRGRWLEWSERAAMSASQDQKGGAA